MMSLLLLLWTCTALAETAGGWRRRLRGLSSRPDRHRRDGQYVSEGGPADVGTRW